MNRGLERGKLQHVGTRLVRLIVARPKARTLRLPDLPGRGEPLELPDRTRVIIRTVELTPNDIVETEVRATRVRRKPIDHAATPIRGVTAEPQ